MGGLAADNDTSPGSAARPMGPAVLGFYLWRTRGPPTGQPIAGGRQGNRWNVDGLRTMAATGQTLEQVRSAPAAFQSNTDLGRRTARFAAEALRGAGLRAAVHTVLRQAGVLGNAGEDTGKK